MTKRKIHRQYLAIAEGMTAKTGRICAPIGRADNSIIERKIDFENGDYAVTNYERLAYNNGYSLIMLKLETGRTHQIRVHLSSINHPLVGDDVYGRKKEEFKLHGQTLHAKVLGFIHPRTGE